MLDNAIRDDYGVDYLIRGSMQVMGENARLNLEITDLKAAKVLSIIHISEPTRQAEI